MNLEKKEYYSQLTSLRGFAAFLVFLMHADMTNFFPIHLFAMIGMQGVMLFFILSGFLMADIYFKKEFEKKEILNFCISRISRVLPLFILVVLIIKLITIYIPSYHSNGGYQALSNNFIFFQSILIWKAKGVLWTVPIEIQFYLWFIFLWFLMKKYSKTYYTFISLTFLCSCILIKFLFFHDKESNIIYLAHVFHLGILISIYKTEITDQLRKINFKHWQLSLLVLGIFLINFPSFKMKLGYFQSVELDPISMILLTIFFILILTSNQKISLFENKFLNILGKISYSFYLLHWLAFDLYLHFFEIRNIFTLIIVFVIAFLGSYTSYHFIELKLNEISKKILSKILLKTEKI